MFLTRPGLRLLAASIMSLMLLSACSSMMEIEPASPPSQIIETDDLWQVSLAAQQWGQEFGVDKVLVVLDLDNTLLAMEQDLGSDQWYYWQKDLQLADRCDPRLVTDRLATQGALLYASAMRPTQDNASTVIQALQSQGFKTIILTSRGPDFSAMTFRELRRNGLDFRASAIGPIGEPALAFTPPNAARKTHYESGVYLTAGQHKGEMLLALLDRTATPMPQVIVMADDKQENLQHVLDAFAGTSASVQAFRYSREDAVVAAFDGEQTVADWKKAEPALLALQEVFGPDNFQLPEPHSPPGCEAE